MYIPAAKVLCYYNVLGVDNTSVVVILCDWPDNQDKILPLAKKLSTKNKIVLLDLPGYGRSQRPHLHLDGEWGVGTYAEWTSEILSKIGIDNIDTVMCRASKLDIAKKFASDKNIANVEVLTDEQTI